RLAHADPACGAAHFVAAAETAAILGDDALRHVPPGIERDRGDPRVELRRRGGPLADDGAVAGKHPAILDESGGEGRDVDEDMAGPEVARHPAPALHIGANDVAAGGVVV